jgi:hypothetical protein
MYASRGDGKLAQMSGGYCAGVQQMWSINSRRAQTEVRQRLTIIQELVEVLAAGRGPADANAVGLSQANGEHEGLPEDGRLLGLHLLEVVDGRACSGTRVSVRSFTECGD